MGAVLLRRWKRLLGVLRKRSRISTRRSCREAARRKVEWTWALENDTTSKSKPKTMSKKPAMACVSHNPTKAAKASYPLPLPLVAASVSLCLGTSGRGTGSEDTGAGGDGEGVPCRWTVPAARGLADGICSV